MLGYVGVRIDSVNGKICLFMLETEELIFMKNFVKQGLFLHTRKKIAVCTF